MVGFYFVPATSIALWKPSNVAPVVRSNDLGQESDMVQHVILLLMKSYRSIIRKP